MHDDGAEVHQHPSGVCIPFSPNRLDALVGEVFVEGVDQRSHVAAVLNAGNDEVVGKGRDGADVQHDNVFRLAVGEGIDNASGNF